MRYFKLIGFAGDTQLIGPDGNRFAAFDAYRELLVRHKISVNSLNAYLGHVARFIEYVYAASFVGLEPTQQTLDALLVGYESYLLYAKDSDIEFVRSIATLTERSRKCSPSSLQVIEAALLQFLKLSDSVAMASGHDGLFSSYLPSVLAPLTIREGARLRASSVLAGVIRGGAKSKRKSHGLFQSNKRRRATRNAFRQKSCDSSFPLDHVESLLGCTPCHRDRALYALIVASGIRPSEAKQIRVDDIDVDRRRVYVVNPFSRKNPGLAEFEAKRLAWKGRETPETFLIEPWGSRFFEALLEYLKHEFVPNAGHPFLFQLLHGDSWGRPLFAGNRSAQIKQFRKRARAAGCELPLGVEEHSLRHSYGIYTLNYLPTPNGLGLSLLLVSTLMGHADIKNTKVYARHDEEIVRAELEWANKAILAKGHHSKKQMLLDFYQSRIAEIMAND